LGAARGRESITTIRRHGFLDPPQAEVGIIPTKKKRRNDGGRGGKTLVILDLTFKKLGVQVRFWG
jgi:hypothetical protein